ncbi:MAG: response regulator [bacterium]
MLDENLLELNEQWMELQAALVTGSEIMLCMSREGLRKQLTERAEQAALRVSAVGTANEAVAGLEGGEIDLLIVAENLPDMSALDLVRFTRGLTVTPEVIILSQTPTPRKVLDAIQLGVADYLLEPEQGPDEILERTLRRLEILGRRKLQRRMITDLRRLHQETPPEERGLLVVTLKRQLERFRRELGPMNRVLIIDKDPIVRKQLGAALGGLGLSPSDALGGNSALELLRAEGADLVIVSNDLTDMAVPEIVSRINEVTEGLPMILLAGIGQLDPALNALRLGFEDCIRKPIASPLQAAHRVARAIKERRRGLLAENLILRLYRLMRTASEVLAPDATAKVEQVFDDMIVVVRDGEPVATAQKNPFEDFSFAHTGSVRLTTGEFEILAEDGVPDILSAEDLPDTVIIEYIDELLVPAKGKTELKGSLGSLGAGQRLTPRVERALFVRYGATGTEQAALGYAHDLSLGGMFILSDAPPPVGTDLQIELQLHDAEKVDRIRLQGRVMWHTNPERRPPQGDGFGVQFTVIAANASAFIRKATTD